MEKLEKHGMIFSTLNVEGDSMVIDMLEKCKERSWKLEEEFYTLSAYSDDIEVLERLSDEMIKMELTTIRLERYRFEKLNGTEQVVWAT